MPRVGRFIISLFIGIALITVTKSAIAPRLIAGVPVDTLRRFPHHVTIVPYRPQQGSLFCAGSILNEQWIVTSAICVDGSAYLELHFEKLYSHSSDGSYTAVVNSDAIHVYPTYYDDIALVKLPFRLIFSDTIKPVSISSTSANYLEGRLAVMPGFQIKEKPEFTTDATDPPYITTSPATTEEPSTAVYTDSTTGIPARFMSEKSEQLSYGMFNILPNTTCKGDNNQFDEYLQLCAEGWSDTANTPCSADYGSGLLVGWPAKSELVGIYSYSENDCLNSLYRTYTNVGKYLSWINSMIYDVNP